MIVVMELERMEEIDRREGFSGGVQRGIDQIPVSGTAGNPFQQLDDKGLGEHHCKDQYSHDEKVFSVLAFDDVEVEG